jgi:hypothetical protein
MSQLDFKDLQQLQKAEWKARISKIEAEAEVIKAKAYAIRAGSYKEYTVVNCQCHGTVNKDQAAGACSFTFPDDSNNKP